MPQTLPTPATNTVAPAALLNRPASAQESAASSRPRLTESGRLLETHRNLIGDRRRGSGSAATLASLTELHQAGQQLQHAISQSRALLDTPIPSLSSPNITSQEYTGETEINRTFKRRRLDTTPPPPPIVPVNYGYYGQVKPGKLNMEIEFCDGGMYSEGSDRESDMYGAANVLKNDSSVYCTKGNRCNLVLKHAGGRPFCLKELIIKAPPRGYTAPVQEGMVFVSMTSDDLLTRTAQYQIQYSPVRRRNQGADARAPVISIRHNDDGTTTATRQSPRIINTDGTPHSPRSAQIPVAFTDPSCTPPFRITTTCSSDTESDSEGASNRSTSRTRARRRIFGYREPLRTFAEGSRFQYPDEEEGGDSDESPDEEEEDDDEDEEEEERRPMELDWTDDVPARVVRPRAARRSEPGRISVALESAIEAADQATQEALKAIEGVGSAASANHLVNAVGGAAEQGLMPAHARFFIERDKSRCKVVFEPEVSGRFILLKMWSPEMRPGGNIDIQSVVVKGWCGPRFFPKTVLR